jgi:hypothetical protein
MTFDAIYLPLHNAWIARPLAVSLENREKIGPQPWERFFGGVFYLHAIFYIYSTFFPRIKAL